MKRILKRFLCVVICACITVTSLTVMSLTQSERDKINNEIAALKQEAGDIQAEINGLKAKKADQAVILAAVRKKIANTQAQIDLCNEKIADANSKIENNKKEIAAKENEIKDKKLAFQKRICAIYMSNSNNSLQILMGAENLDDFLQLSQLTSTISAHDKRLIDDLVAEISVINSINEENEKLLNDQIAVKKEISQQQAELNKQEQEAAAIYNQIANDQAGKQDDLNDVNAEVKKLQRQLESDIANKNYATFINPNTGFQWPVSGFFSISAGYKSNDDIHKGRHNGIDIAGGGIANQPIRAAADGVVDRIYNGCTHNYKKYGNCCGNGYGNFAVINHGTMTVNGKSSNYVAWYAHATRITVSVGQRVKQGQVIGYVGTTGWSTGYHLHFGITRNGGWINPYPLFF